MVNEFGKFKFAVLILTLLAAGGAIWFGVFHEHNHRVGSESPRSDVEATAQQLVTDRVNLRNPAIGETERTAIMIRLAERQEPEALTEAQSLAGTDSVSARGAAAAAIGYFADEQGLALLEKLIADRDVGVRRRAIAALASRPSEARDRRLAELSQHATDPQDQVAALAALAEAGLLPATRTHSLSALRALANVGVPAEASGVSEHGKTEPMPDLAGTPDEQRTARALAAVRVSELAPKDLHTQSMLRGRMAAAFDPLLDPVGIRTLSEIRDPWLADRLSRYLTAADPETRIEALRSLPRYCPRSRWETLGRALAQEKIERVRAAILLTYVEMSGAAAVAELAQVIQDAPLAPYAKHEAQDALQRLRTEPPRDPCRKAP